MQWQLHTRKSAEESSVINTLSITTRGSSDWQFLPSPSRSDHKEITARSDHIFSPFPSMIGTFNSVCLEATQCTINLFPLRRSQLDPQLHGMMCNALIPSYFLLCSAICSSFKALNNRCRHEESAHSAQLSSEEFADEHPPPLMVPAQLTRDATPIQNR